MENSLLPGVSINYRETLFFCLFKSPEVLFNDYKREIQTVEYCRYL
jgi:hypothetical protein